MLKTKYIFFDLSGTLIKMRPAKLLVKKSLLRKLSKTYSLGIVTGAKRSESLNIMNKLGVSNCFKILITKDDTKFSKPDIRTIGDTRNYFRILAYIGDTKKDEYFARNLNVPFFRVNKRYNINEIIIKFYE